MRNVAIIMLFIASATDRDSTRRAPTLFQALAASRDGKIRAVQSTLKPPAGVLGYAALNVQSGSWVTLINSRFRGNFLLIVAAV
jgi:hypothetical protein